MAAKPASASVASLSQRRSPSDHACFVSAATEPSSTPRAARPTPTLPPARSAHLAQGDNPQATTHFELQRIFDLDMDRPMASFAHGPFGGSTCDQVACLSMDGMLTVVDRGAIVVKRQLPNCLLPGPLLYVPTIDSFVTATSAFEVECYRFSSLVDGKADALPAFWRVIIGEPALEVAVARLTPSLAQGQIDIIVLGERTLFAMSETGQLRLQMRLDYPPQALTAFPLRDGRSGIIVASSTGALMVYHERRLMWSARTTTAPVSIRIDRFNRVPGVLVLLDAQGRLTIAYLGTAPSTTLAGTARVALSEQDYEAMDEETHKLMAVIRQASAGEAEARPEPLDVVKVRAQVPAALDAQRDQRRGPGGDDSGHGAGGGPQVTVRLFLTYTVRQAPRVDSGRLAASHVASFAAREAGNDLPECGHHGSSAVVLRAAPPRAAQGAGAVTGATLHVEPPYPVRCAQRTVEVPTIRGGGAGTPVTVPVVLLASKEGLPGSNVMTVTVSYATAGGEPRTAVVDVALPLALFAVAVPAVKAAKFKLTLDTNRPPPVLTSLFEDALGPPIGSVTNVVTVQYWCGDTVTAIVSKSAGRYRLQSDNFEAMWLLAEDLCARLAAYFALEPQMPPEGPFRVTFSEVLPLDDFFSVIDAHFAARKQLSANAQALSQRAEQFRVVQKRLLVRYKDKTPLPLGPLNALLEGSFRDLQEAGVLVERTQREVRRGHARLQGAARLTVLLVQSRFGLSKENAEALRSYLCVGAEETQEIGWPEVRCATGAGERGGRALSPVLFN